MSHKAVSMALFQMQEVRLLLQIPKLIGLPQTSHQCPVAPGPVDCLPTPRYSRPSPSHDLDLQAPPLPIPGA